MKDNSRRNFVKTSAATGLTFTFAGLIRAHGQSGGGNTTWNPEGTFSSTNSGETTTYDPNGTYVTTEPGVTTTWDPDATTVPETTVPEETTTVPQTTTMPTHEWSLICSKNPIGSVNVLEDLNQGSNQNPHPNRTWWTRNKTDWDDFAVCLEVRGTGPIQWPSHGVVPPDKVSASFTVSAKLKAYLNIDENDGDNIWEDFFYDDPNNDTDNLEWDKMAYVDKDLGNGVIAINTSTGEVSFQDNPPVIREMASGCDSALVGRSLLDSQVGPYDGHSTWGDYKLVGAGVIAPQIQVSGACGLVAISDSSYQFSLGASVGIVPPETGGVSGNVSVGSTITTKHLPQSAPDTLAWGFYRVRREFKDGEWGPWIAVDPAVASGMLPTLPVPNRP